MFKRLQGIVIGCVLCFLLTSVVFAKTGTETIQALYNNIKIYVDGVKVETKDVNGNSVEPFIYNGTTYLPVRAVGEAIGKTVTWDGMTQSVYLGQVPGQTQSWMDVCKPYDYNAGDEYLPSGNKFFTMSGKDYVNGFTLCNNKGSALFNLNGEYNSLSFKVGHLDGHSQTGTSTINVYLDGLLVCKEKITSDGGIKNITVPLDGAMHMKIEMEYNDTWEIDPSYGFAEGVFD